MPAKVFGSGLSDEARSVGPLLGTFANSYYWFEDENGYLGPRDTALPDHAGHELALVRGGFAERVCIEGMGRMGDGRVINLMGTGRSCVGGGYKCTDGGGLATCFSLLDAAKFPWGMGSQKNALVPLRSWATNNFKNGTVLYSPDWDGVSIPRVTDSSGNIVGGYVHDGCFRVDDIGYGLGGNHIDFFTGPKQLYLPLEGIVATNTGFKVHRGAAHCTPVRWERTGAPI